MSGHQVDSTHESRTMSRDTLSMLWKFGLMVLVGAVIFFIPVPEGVDPRGMHMLGIFVATILGLILQPLPTPSVALIGLATAMITGAMDVKSGEALSGFSNSAVLLIVAAFFIADGFLLTGLGRRVALMFLRVLGKSPLGIAYGMAVTDLLLAPATPSNTARAGGVIYPIVRSVAEVQGSTPDTDESRRKLGSYLTFSAAHVNVITSAMFITAMAGNPLAVASAEKLGVHISWGQWALAALIPGLVSLAVVPWLLMKVYPPTLKSTPEAPTMAHSELQKMGSMTRGEIIMAATFVLLLLLWVFGTAIGVNATTAAFVGIAVLLVTKVLTWNDMAKNGSAWNTLIFFAVLVGMAENLNNLGVITWIGSVVSGAVGGMSWPVAFAILALVYFYAHYMFASNTAQIVAMYGVFLGAAITAGAPPMFAALALGYIGNLFGAISHYASGPSGVVYGSGYVKVSEWFKVAFIMSVAIIVIWTVVGTGWMWVLGDLAM